MRSLKLLVNVALTSVVLLNLCLLNLKAQSRPTQPDASRKTFQLAATGGSIAYPAGWTEQHYANVRELWNIASAPRSSSPSRAREDVARIQTSITPVKDHQEALHRLREIEAEWGTTPKYVVMGGWPALQRRQFVPKPHEGAEVETDHERLIMITTAIAAGASVVRLDGFAPEAASPAVVDQMESIMHSWRPAAAGDPGKSESDVQNLRSSPSLRMSPASSGTDSLMQSVAEATLPVKAAGKSPVKAGAAVNIGTLDLEIGSESEVAVSANGTNIVVARQCQYENSADGGASFPFGGGYPGSGGHCTGGDSSLAYGLSGNFYWETIGSNSATCPVVTPPNTNCNNTQEIARSTDGGETFSFVANVIDCQVTSGCGFGNIPDQEHIGADRVNAGTSGDQVYAAFREGFGFGIACSQDSAATWSAVSFYNNGSTDFPRVTVGQNGTVYVITNNGSNIELWSFSSCKSGLTLGLNHVTVASGINEVTCPVAGLDRCNDGNILSSHTVAVDDTNASHLYAAYAVNTVAPPSNTSFPGNENVMVRESTDGGSTWSSAVQINQGTSGSGGRRFQPWVCATGGTAYVSWFDRRNSTSGTNDVTDYYSSSAFDNPGLTGGTDFQIDANGDPQCASGWPCQSRSKYDSESCSAQPQFGGACRHSPNNSMDSFQACNIAAPSCTDPTETCQLGGGCPKYADYTGNACLLGRLYNVWPSATDQPGAVSAGGRIVSFFAETVVGSTATTTTYTGDTSDIYETTANLSATLVLKGTSVPVVGQTIAFAIGTQSCNGTTNSSGSASCSFTLTQTPGPYTVTATFATSGNYQGSSASAAFAITLPASITSANAATFLVGSLGSFTVTTTGYPTPSIMESGALPSGVTFVDNGNGTGTLKGIPAANTGGIYNLTFTATNGIGSPAVQSFTLTVDQPASITSAGSAVFTIGVAGSFTVTTAGFPIPSITESGHLPTGLSFKDNGNGTGTLSGTPLVFDGGNFSITFTATNGIGSPAVQTFTIILQQAPAFTSANSAVFVFGVPNSFTVTTVGFPAPTIHESGTLPPWLTFVDHGNGTATLSGTPSYVSGTFPLVLTATNPVTTATQNFTLTVSGLNLSPSTLSFGFVYLNSSTTLPVTVTNVGSSTVSISGVSITPGTEPAGTYTFVNHCTSPLPAGKSCIIDVTFKAKAEGTLTATLNLTDNAVGTPQHVALTGNVLDPVAKFNPTKLAFGTEAVGSSTTLPVQLTNSGLTPLDISGIAASGDFTETNSCPAILSSAMSCTISVTFKPTVTGARTGTLTVTDNVAAGQSTLALTGTGN